MTVARAVPSLSPLDPGFDAAAEETADAPAPHCGGRPRDERASRAIADATLRQLAEVGYARMSVESIACEAGVSRATVYRRYRDKADLVTAAIAAGRGREVPTDPRAPLESLVTLLEEFDARFAESCLEVVGCLLAAREEPGAMALHRRRVVEPRIAAVRGLLERAHELGQLRDDADVGLLTEMLVGAVFARRVAGEPPERGWAHGAVDAVLRGAGA